MERKEDRAQRQVKDAQSWAKRIADVAKARWTQEDFQEWVVSQFKNELAPLLEAAAKAQQADLLGVYEQVDAIGDVVIDLVEQEGSYLRFDLANSITDAINLGLAICDGVMSLDPQDIKTQEALAASIEKYLEAAPLALDEIQLITEEDTEKNVRFPGESERAEGHDGGGESSDGSKSSPPNGTEETTEGGG